MTEFEDASQAWIVSARVCDERELAVYCCHCARPHPTRNAERNRDDSATSGVARV